MSDVRERFPTLVAESAFPKLTEEFRGMVFSPNAERSQIRFLFLPIAEK